ncbi:MAG: YibE/F family protein [Anaerolineae bacterium]|nr:YibE/F family protein [Thermoflexales bacterium]MDW8408520.1 YibE/F family protein [Anaerolineae bacterium]
MKGSLNLSAASLGAALILGLAVVAFGVLILGAPAHLGAITTAPADLSETVEGRVVRVIETRQVEIGPGQVQPVQRLLVEVLSGAARGQQIEVEHGSMSLTQEQALYRAGDLVLVMLAIRPDGSQMAMITGYLRTPQLAALVACFIAGTILVSGWKGVRALIGLAISFVVVMGFVLPQILAGRDPVVISVVGSFVLLSVTLYLTQGWTLKTHAALFGIFLSLIVSGVLISLAAGLTRLTGYGSEDAFMLQASGSPINLRGLLLASMMIGALGVLDDVVVGQASAVNELAAANPALSWRELYRRAMNVGHDHIAATVNTLVLAYVGAAMPLLLLFYVYPEPWTHTLNRDLIAEEIVRSLAGSLSLITAVPITTLIASLLRRPPAMRTTSVPADRSAASRLTVVYDDHPLDQRLRPDHGFACLIEAHSRRILFDTGADGATLIYNLTVLGIDARGLDAVVLSHVSADHTGGLNAILHLNPGLTVYLPAGADSNFKAGLRGRAHLIEVQDTVMVGDGVRLFTAESDACVEQAVMIETAGGHALLIGCAHLGVVELVRAAHKWGAVSAIVGDFHLKESPAEHSAAVASELRCLGVRTAAPAHATDEAATWAFRSVFGAGFVLAGVGAVIELTT